MAEQSEDFPAVDIARLHAESVAKYGTEHTHDQGCRTWRGQNWAGACDCSLPSRTPLSGNSEETDHG